MNGLFIEFSIILILAGVVSFLVSLLKQPSIIGYIITGLIVGPLGYYHLQNSDVFSGLAQIGITLLLFMVGMQLDISQLKKIGSTALFVGLAQVAFTSGLGFLVLRALNFSTTSALYMAPTLAFASTIIVVKLLGEKKDLQSLYGKLVVGIFLTQDLVAILILISLSSFSSTSGGIYSSLPLWQSLMMAIVRALILILTVWWMSAKLLPKVVKVIGHNDELMLVFSLAWALGLATFVAMPLIGFSLEIGGFLAGLALGRSGVHYEIGGKIKPIRDFFIMIFFIVLGSEIYISSMGQLIIPALALSAVVLFATPLFVITMLGAFGYKPRTSFLAGVTVAQISEFSLILATSGKDIGALGQNEVALITLVAMLTISLSSYMIMYSAQIFEKLKFIFKHFDFRKGFAEKHLQTAVLKNHIILVGAHRLGHHLISTLVRQKTSFIIVDFNPEIVEKYIKQNLLAVCGDITDSFIQEQINLPNAKMVVSTVPDFNDNLNLIDTIHNIKGKRKPKLIFLAQDEAETKMLYDKKVDYVISPHFMGGLHLAKVLEGKEGNNGLKKLREHHLEVLFEQSN